jgi:hypothetical protein
MKIVNKSLLPVIETAIKESLESYESNNDGNSLSDLYLHYDDENEEIKFSVYDDMENLLNEVQFPKEEALNTHTIRFVLQKMEQEQFFNREYIIKPFTVSLVDDSFIVLEELIFIDDDTLKLNDGLLAGLDKELDDFIKKLLE